MSDLFETRIQAHRLNIERFSRLLEAPLSEQEREYIHKRIAEEQAALDHLQSTLAAKP